MSYLDEDETVLNHERDEARSARWTDPASAGVWPRVNGQRVPLESIEDFEVARDEQRAERKRRRYG